MKGWTPSPKRNAFGIWVTCFTILRFGEPGSLGNEIWKSQQKWREVTFFSIDLFLFKLGRKQFTQNTKFSPCFFFTKKAYINCDIEMAKIFKHFICQLFFQLQDGRFFFFGGGFSYPKTQPGSQVTGGDRRSKKHHPLFFGGSNRWFLGQGHFSYFYHFNFIFLGFFKVFFQLQGFAHFFLGPQKNHPVFLVCGVFGEATSMGQSTGERWRWWNHGIEGM